jgi:hypothetical protein
VIRSPFAVNLYFMHTPRGFMTRSFGGTRRTLHRSLMICLMASSVAALFALSIAGCKGGPAVRGGYSVSFRITKISVGPITNASEVVSEDQPGKYTKGFNVDAFRIVGLGSSHPESTPLDPKMLPLDSPQRRDFVLKTIGDGGAVQPDGYYAVFQPGQDPRGYGVQLRICVWNRGVGHNHSGWVERSIAWPDSGNGPSGVLKDEVKIDYSLGTQLSDPQASLIISYEWESH